MHVISDLVVVCKAHLVLPQSLYSSSEGKTGKPHWDLFWRKKQHNFIPKGQPAKLRPFTECHHPRQEGWCLPWPVSFLSRGPPSTGRCAGQSSSRHEPHFWVLQGLCLAVGPRDHSWPSHSNWWVPWGEWQHCVPAADGILSPEQRVVMAHN